jgi:hypothetical protein
MRLDSVATAPQLLHGNACQQVTQQVRHRWCFGDQGTIALREVATDYPAIAIKQRIGETVDVTVKRPRAGGGVHRCIVAEGVRPEQYDPVVV